jgi:hypothetical protein
LLPPFRQSKTRHCHNLLFHIFRFAVLLFSRRPPFTPAFMTVVTYFGLAEFSNAARKSTVQVTLASESGGRSFVTLCFDQLTYGQSQAAVGFNGPLSTSFYNFPESRGASVRSLSCGGNGGNGCYTFRVDGSTVVVASPTPSPSATFVPTPSQSPSLYFTYSQTPSISFTPTQSRTPPRRLSCALYSGLGSDPCCQGLTTLYAFGLSASDSVGATGDDSNAVTLSWAGIPFKFFGVNYNAMYFSTNGWLCFTTSDTSFSSIVFPTYVNPVNSRKLLTYY